MTKLFEVTWTAKQIKKMKTRIYATTEDEAMDLAQSGHGKTDVVEDTGLTAYDFESEFIENDEHDGIYSFQEENNRI